MIPVSIIQLGVGRSLRLGRQAEQAAERVERVEAPIEPERELVEVRLQVVGAHPVVRAVDPRLQVAEHEVDDRQVLGSSGHYGWARWVITG
jgi:hypothetical protein